MWTALLLSALVAAPEAQRPFTVALDPGHGGTNLGAMGLGEGVYEKRLTLQIAQRVKRRLERHRQVRLVLCRDRDVLVPIRARVRCANEAGADLFLSLHANASPEGPSRGTQKGFELYVLPVDQADREAALALARAGDVSEGVWQAQRVHLLVETSLEAAKRLQLELADALGAEADRGVKQQGAALDVLQGLHMPGVLVEVAFIDHPEEGKAITDEATQERIAAALAKGISDLAARARRAHADPGITGHPRRR
ncbi:MAG: N-acetylmuramoyl-L-alanine amidase [Myxococcales bacterium]|nr:N-acetylmuramoyl-L-alanine amidase [Myxococcales bacterium]